MITISGRLSADGFRDKAVFFFDRFHRFLAETGPCQQDPVFLFAGFLFLPEGIEIENGKDAVIIQTDPAHPQGALQPECGDTVVDAGDRSSALVVVMHRDHITAFRIVLQQFAESLGELKSRHVDIVIVDALYRALPADREFFGMRGKG